MTADALQRLLTFARDGERLVHVPLLGKERTLWPGLGNRAGLHGFADELLREKFKKGEAGLRKKLAALPPGSRVEVRTFRNRTRDAGRWTPVCRLEVGHVPAR